jgi:hypothetical protein
VGDEEGGGEAAERQVHEGLEDAASHRRQRQQGNRVVAVAVSVFVNVAVVAAADTV